MSESYPRPAPLGRDAVRPVSPPEPVVAHPVRRDAPRPTSKAEAEAEAESDRLAGGVLARAKARL